ncbi:hypothetical protein P171DRAFT_179802 [Karstenula rhodostoma CBS 690.94]|uniref:Uncharacterized protein n=1 Tax=Karstenula rhodostoma CBS 690.94 TaxID=1392251 RepID=A0A9P4P573_9PLEO|nr:hypothetical protein P171DRAFT_179802 [Karstenula rhodostoma CBS 690.94]
MWERPAPSPLPKRRPLPFPAQIASPNVLPSRPRAIEVDTNLRSRLEHRERVDALVWSVEVTTPTETGTLPEAATATPDPPPTAAAPSKMSLSYIINDSETPSESSAYPPSLASLACQAIALMSSSPPGGPLTSHPSAART